MAMTPPDRQDAAGTGGHPASRMDGVSFSPILAAMARAQALRAAGREIIDLTIGEPDLDTPAHVVDAAIAAMKRGATRYTPVAGTVELRRAIAEKFGRDNGLDYAADQIVVGAGSKQLIFNAMIATLDPGDEVIVPAPYWTSYPDIVRICGGRPVVVNCSAADGFKLTAASLARAITPRTKWLILNSPSNPTGAVYTAAELGALGGALADAPQVMVLCDDIYEHLCYGGAAHHTVARCVPALRARTLTLNGVSKAYCMTGWRIGFGGGPKWLVDLMVVAQSQSTSGACSISQAAAVAALQGGGAHVRAMTALYDARRRITCDALAAIDGLSIVPPDGAFYVFAGSGGVIGRGTADGRIIRSDADLAAFLLEDAGVAVVPGAAFGASPYLRLSFAVAEPTLRTGCERMRAAIGRLR